MEAFAGRYRLIDLIGTGGMGSVWRAWDLRRSAYVAAKVLGQHDAATLLRFVREQSVRIQHPHVVAPHGWAADDDKVVFAMDLVRGGSVATLLGDHGPLPASYVAVLLDQLLHGLSAVHAAGVVHRDLKPANLLLDVTGTGRPHLRLSDFGVAGLIGEPRMTRTSTILGTPGYLAPEQLAGADPDPRQDLYTIGAVALELLTGQRPTPSPLSPPANAPSPAPAEPLASAAPLAEFIRRCMATDPSERPESAHAAARLLAESGVLPHAGETPWANHPDSPEVFDQLPPLPPAWTPTGPAQSAPPPRPQPIQAPQPTPRPQPAPSPEPAPPPQPTRTPQPAQATRPARVAIAATAPTAQPPAASAAAAQPSAAPHPDTTPPNASQPTRVATADPLPTSEKSKASLRSRGLVWVAAGCFAGAAALLGSAAWLLLH
ncbi:protein kinase [Kribbella sp. NPDC050281]|uniref:serine/threonine-protein kinase n=1 Tax=Kribbella sp. NPDC050281 TaxID=3155515 RepID=UPI0033C76F85